jgi:hypothetical protein
MANGKHGDRPLTDLLVHGLRVYSDHVERLVLDIDYLGGRDWLEREMPLDWRDPDAAFVEQLRAVRARLLADARNGGWELPPGRFESD